VLWVVGVKEFRRTLLKRRLIASWRPDIGESQVQSSLKHKEN